MNAVMIRSNLEISHEAEVVDPDGDHWVVGIRRPGEKPISRTWVGLSLWAIEFQRLARVLGQDKRWAVEVRRGGFLTGLGDPRTTSVEADLATALDEAVRLALDIQIGSSSILD